MANLDRQLTEAQALLQRGDGMAALRVINAVLKRAPSNPQALWLLGMAKLTSGDATGAVAPLERALAPDPRNGVVLDGLGLAYLMLGRHADAANVLKRAAALPQAPAIVHMRLGLALLNSDDAAGAVNALRTAVQLAPADPDMHLNLGQALHRTGGAVAARGAFDAALRLAPAHADAHFNVGVLDLEEGQLTAAARAFERAIQLAPHHAEAWVNLGVVREREGQYEAALDCHRKALDAGERTGAAHRGAGRALALLGRHGEARAALLEAIQLAPADTAAREGLYTSCIALGRVGEALPHIRRVLDAEPENLPALQALASALFESGQLEEAGVMARRALALAPDSPGACMLAANLLIVKERFDEAIATVEGVFERTGDGELLGLLAHLYRQVCDWTQWQRAWDKLAPRIDTGDALGSPFWLLSQPITPMQQLRYTQTWAAARFGKSVAMTHAQKNPPHDRRLKIGYLSSDFQEHAAAYLVADVLEQHDRERFEVYAYSYGPRDNSPMRRRIVDAVEHFVDIAWDPDDIAAARIRQDHIDILVELKGYTMGDRISIMAHRPCDIQVTWLGYPGTTGAPFVDYLIADPYIIRDGEEATCSERVLRMPHCYEPNDRKREIAAPLTRTAYGLPEQGFVFCCFNQTYKITPDVFAVWMHLLQRVPGSVLWLVESNVSAKRNLALAAQAHGIEASRLIFAPRMPYAKHLARYRIANLALDTWPYTSHTTLSDGLWCGCPAVALSGDTFAARVSGSILSACNLADLITHNLDDYETLVYRIATEPDLLEQLRTRLRQAHEMAPMFDSAAFARGLEALYLRISAG